jgi:tRNA-dihydrouridine synthase
MRIGDVDVRGLARLAPMAGATYAPFRLVARECGCGLTSTE